MKMNYIPSLWDFLFKFVLVSCHIGRLNHVSISEYHFRSCAS
jgi:hypothetical protein